jgi:hypothetical protein
MRNLRLPRYFFPVLLFDRDTLRLLLRPAAQAKGAAVVGYGPGDMAGGYGLAWRRST